MFYLGLVFICNTVLFIMLLENKFKIYTTLAVSLGVFVLSLVGYSVLGNFVTSELLHNQLACGLNCLFLFISSIFIYKNNLIHNLYVAILAMSNFAFFTFAIEQIMGVMPFDVSGTFGAVFTSSMYLFLTIFVALCLYSVFHYFVDRGVSKFMIGITIIQIFSYTLNLGKFDLVFKSNPLAERFLYTFIIYTLIIFIFRSIYHAACFREKVTYEAERRKLVNMKAKAYSDIFASITMVNNSIKKTDYLLDTVMVLAHDKHDEDIVEYIKKLKLENKTFNSLGQFSENPYVNALLTTKSAFCQKNNIKMESNVIIGNSEIPAPEICIVIEELLDKACASVLENNENKHIRLTVFPTEHELSFELLYSSPLEKKKKSALKEKNFSAIFNYLFLDSSSQEDSSNLENTEEIILRYSGNMSISGSGTDTIIKAIINQ